MFRRVLMADFKVRAACWNKPYKVRHTWNEQDADGDILSWVTKYEKRGKDKENQHYHVQGPDGKNLKEKCKWSNTVIVRCYDPPHEEFPSHSCPTFYPEKSVVTGDDGTTWPIGSRGNSLPVLKQEVIHHPELWPAEKDDLLCWLDGPRKLIPDPDCDDPEYIIRWVDSYFCDRIRKGNPDTTEEEIQSSGLPDKYVENLILNFRNYTRHEP